ncbi:MAG TPA: hypothetical protein VFM88_06880 [Vicinamibacteria bacterium]|nr:hypothetical protein [Vicinamibacteria bacterium]
MGIRVEAGALVAVGVGTFVACLLALALGSLTPGASALGLLAGLTCGVLAGRAVAPVGARPAAGELAAAGVLGAVALRQFLWLLAEREGEVLTWDYFNYGDLPLHITFIRFFANGAPFWPENPLFTATRLQYPIGIDLFQAMLLQAGLPLASGLALVGLLASAATAAALLRWAGGLAVLAFVLSGGLGDSQDLAWKNLFLALFVTQRGFLFALPAGLLLLACWRRRFLEGGPALMPAWVEGLLWGTLPLLHLHTFLLVSLMFALWAAATRRAREAWPTFRVAVLPATLGVLLVTDFFRASSLLGWKPGWTMGDDHPVAFFLKNFTIYPALVAWAAWEAHRSRERTLALTLFPGLAVWAALFFVKLAPWAWDNTKVMVWCYLLTLPSIGRALSSLPFAARAGVLTLWLFPGIGTMANATLGREHGYVVYQRWEVDEVCGALRSVPIAARVAVEPTFNHPVALCGHPLVAGYGGHLWTYGIDPRFVETRLKALLDGQPDWERAAMELRARFLFWGSREAQAHPGSRRPWEASRALVAEGRWGRLYDLSSAK